MEKRCDRCGKLTPKKYLGKIRKEHLCKGCQKLRLKERRKETIKSAGIKAVLHELQNKIKREYSKKYYRKKNPSSVPYNKNIPQLKSIKKKKTNSYCYLTIQEKQDLFRILINRGIDAEGVKERIRLLDESQRELSKRLIKNKKSEEAIVDNLKLNKQKILEELWKY